MTLKEYLFGRRIILRSAHRKDWVIDRIKGAVPGPFASAESGVSGMVLLGRLRLAWIEPHFSNGFRPVFRGKLVEHGRDTDLHAVYGATTYLRVFFAFWYSAMAMFVFASVKGVLTDGISSESFAALAIAPVFVFIPVGFHLFFNTGADRHFDEILALLKREAGFVQVDDPRETAG